MEPIELNNRSNPEHEAQISFLIKREFYVSYYKLRKLPYYLIGSTIAVFVLLLSTSPDRFIVLKSMSIVSIFAGWAGALGLLVILMIKWWKKYLWKKKIVALARGTDKSSKFYFDEEKIVFEGATFKTEVAWNHYMYWTENRNSLFIFPPNNIYDALAFSISELGTVNFLKLKNYASSKLEELPNIPLHPW